MRVALFSFIAFGLLFTGAFQKSQTLLAGDLEYSTRERIIDFGIHYPIVTLDNGYEKRQDVTAGFTFNYQFFFPRRYGFFASTSAFFIPSRVNNQNTTVWMLGVETGPVVRFLPGSYFDPSLAVGSGIGISDAGATIERRFVYPVIGRFSANLYRNTARFSDRSLALNFFVTGRKVFNNLEAYKSANLDIGLAFRGSF